MDYWSKSHEFETSQGCCNFDLYEYKQFKNTFMKKKYAQFESFKVVVTFWLWRTHFHIEFESLHTSLYENFNKNHDYAIE